MKVEGRGLFEIQALSSPANQKHYPLRGSNSTQEWQSTTASKVAPRWQLYAGRRGAVVQWCCVCWRDAFSAVDGANQRTGRVADPSHPRFQMFEGWRRLLLASRASPASSPSAAKCCPSLGEGGFSQINGESHLDLGPKQLSSSGQCNV